MMSASAAARTSDCIVKVMQRLRALPDGQYLQCLVAYHAAPTLLGVKPATLICPDAKGRDLEGILSEGRPCLGLPFGVDVAGFRNRAGALLILVYDRALLAEALARPDVRRLLADVGYDVALDGVDQYLATLGQRCSGPEFPHEVGVFLGYPAREVRAFMRRRGQGCRRTGCWKAYHDVQAVARASARYRRLKTRAAEIIAAGAEPCEVVQRLRQVA